MDPMRHAALIGSISRNAYRQVSMSPYHQIRRLVMRQELALLIARTLDAISILPLAMIVHDVQNLTLHHWGSADEVVPQ